MNKQSEAIVLTVIYLAIILITTAVVFARYPKSGYVWTLILAFILWALAGALSVWYAWMNDKKGFAIFFFIFFVGLYWLGIYSTLEQPGITLNAFLTERLG